jgi:hypothetical protein
MLGLIPPKTIRSENVLVFVRDFLRGKAARANLMEKWLGWM